MKVKRSSKDIGELIEGYNFDFDGHITNDRFY